MKKLGELRGEARRE